MKFSHIKNIAGLLLAASLSTQCGEDGLSSQVEFNCRPCDPVVINASVTLNSVTINEVEVEAPWYIFSYDVKNDADVDVIVAGITIEMTGIKNGVSVESEHPLDAGDNLDDNDSDCDGIVAEDRVILSAVQANGSYVETVLWYVDALSEADSERYRGIGEAVGWFEQEDNGANDNDGCFNGIPGSRFEKTFRIFTQ